MAAIRTSRKYATFPDTALSRFGGKTIAGFTGNADFPTPPVPPADLGTQKQGYDAAIIRADKGGVVATARKDALRVEFIASLNKNASYVDINCDEDLTILLSSGYEAISTNRAQSVLNSPQILSVEMGQTGELKARIKADANTKSFVGRIKTVDGEYGPQISFASSRRIAFSALTSGAKYVFQLMAIGGKTGQSDWSEPASGMAP